MPANKVQLSYNSAFVKALMDAGIVPPNCKRFVIDVPANEPITIHYEVFTDTRIDDPGILSVVQEIGIQINERKQCPYVGDGGVRCEMPAGHHGVCRAIGQEFS